MGAGMGLPMGPGVGHGVHGMHNLYGTPRPTEP